MSLVVYDFSGNKVGSKELPSTLSGIDTINEHLIWESIVVENANMRQGTHKTKTRGEVRGGGRKPWKQKGTGRARAGSNRSPIWVGGGVAFGPQPRSYRMRFNYKKKKLAYKNIFAKKYKEEQFSVLKDIILPTSKTSEAFKSLVKLVDASRPKKEVSSSKKKIRANSNQNRKMITIIVEQDNSEWKKTFRNIPWIQLVHIRRLSARKLLYNHGLFITDNALSQIGEVL